MSTYSLHYTWYVCKSTEVIITFWLTVHVFLYTVTLQYYQAVCPRVVFHKTGLGCKQLLRIVVWQKM